MNNLEIYQLFLDTLTAFGTIGAVFLSLWLVHRKPARYRVKDAQIGTEIVLDKTNFNRDISFEDKSYVLSLTIENLSNVPMRIFGIHINASNSKFFKLTNRHSTIFTDEKYIPENSIYSVIYKINTKVAPGTYSKAESITLTITSNLGDKTIKFPKDMFASLFQAIE